MFFHFLVGAVVENTNPVPWARGGGLALCLRDWDSAARRTSGESVQVLGAGQVKYRWC